jgi:3-hydroxyisobutyrate dehydrogenase-like beta-hydroxyacid dehydrogenase
MSDDEATVAEQWQLKGAEIDVQAVLDELREAYPAVRFEVESAEDADEEALTSRKPLRDINVVDIIITAVITKAAQETLLFAYNKLKELAQDRSIEVEEKTDEEEG